jgi:hypothetical protein
MTTENEGFDVEKFAQDGLDQAGIKPEETTADDQVQQQPAGVVSKTNQEPAGPEPDGATPQEDEPKETPTDAVQAALKVTEEPPKADEPEPEVESTIAELLPKAEEPEAKPGPKVPLDDHIKLRQRAQQAERERDEALQRLAATTQQQTQEVEPLEKWTTENPEDAQISPPPASVMLAQRKFEQAQGRTRAEAQRRADEAEAGRRQAMAGIQAKASKAQESEKSFRASHPDYTKVTKAALKANLLSKEERDAVLDAENPGQELYDLAKAKLTAIQEGLGITTPTAEPQPKPAGNQTPATGAPGEEPELSDDDIFDEVFKDKPR